MGQHWKNAPLCFTVAQARFNTVLKLENYVPQLQEQLRKKGYPDFSEQQRVTFTLSNSGAENHSPQANQTTSYLFANIEGNEAFSLDNNALSLLTTAYDNRNDFLSKFFYGLDLVHNAIELSYCERLGLRYVDVVVPKQGDTLQQYLDEGVTGQMGKWDELVHAYSETQASSRGSRITSRTLIREGELAFPPDLAGISLQIADQFTQIKALHAILDNDAFCGFGGKREPFNIESLKAKMETLRQLDRDAFACSTTDYARKYWQGE